MDFQQQFDSIFAPARPVCRRFAMSRMSYEEAVEKGYDGPSPIADRRYRNDMMRHPDCRDPDHPGCPSCEPDDFNDDNDEENDDE